MEMCMILSRSLIAEAIGAEAGHIGLMRRRGTPRLRRGRDRRRRGGGRRLGAGAPFGGVVDALRAGWWTPFGRGSGRPSGEAGRPFGRGGGRPSGGVVDALRAGWWTPFGRGGGRPSGGGVDALRAGSGRPAGGGSGRPAGAENCERLRRVMALSLQAFTTSGEAGSPLSRQAFTTSGAARSLSRPRAQPVHFHDLGRSPFTAPAKPFTLASSRSSSDDIYGLACSGWVHFISVLAAVEAKPAAPVLASLAASTAAPRTAVGLAMARKPARPKSPGVSRWRFKSKSSVSN